MIASFLIAFRETLEAALVVGIVLGYLARIGQSRYNRLVYLGIAGGVLASVAGAWLFVTLTGGFEGRAEQIFEGLTMLVGALLLTTMILWMMGQRHIAAELERKVASELAAANQFGLVSLAFVAVLREGVETVIFLRATTLASAGNSLLGALAGIVAAALLGYFMFASSLRVNVKALFNLTSLVLILFAAGLLAHGVGEFQEAGLLPAVVEHVWDLSAVLGTGGFLGGMLHALFGYNPSPSLLEVLSYVGYLAVVGLVWRRPRGRS
jgi:high-affinity iron transporter